MSLGHSTENTTTLPDGRIFPVYEGEILSWDIHCYNSLVEEIRGCPKMRAVIRALKENFPEKLIREYRDLVGDSLGKIFGHVAKKTLKVVREEGADVIDDWVRRSEEYNYKLSYSFEPPVITAPDSNKLNTGGEMDLSIFDE